MLIDVTLRSLGTPRKLWLLIGSIAVAACAGDSPPGGAEPNEQLTEQRTPDSGLRLSEVRFAAADDAPPFVEIVNVGTAPETLDGVALRTQRGELIELPGAMSIAPGARVVVSFDDGTGIEGDVVHRAAADVGDGVSLHWRSEVIDAVAWGRLTPDSVDLCRGGRCSTPALGSVVARLPSAAEPFSVPAWALLDPENATPGAPNPRPRVTAFAALPGAIFSGPPRFSWYGVPGATSYRLQVAADPSFGSLVYEASVEATSGARLEQLSAQGPALPPGSYAWRVQPLDGAGDAAEFSQPQPFTVDPSRAVRSSAEAADEGTARGAANGSPGDAPPGPNAPLGLLKLLDVPVIRHAKDTRMLALEAWSEQSPGSWDTPDQAGYPYCARAGVAMLNAYHGGRLSQDRLGYEAFKDLRAGAEYDLPVVGISDSLTTRHLLPLALGTSGRYRSNDVRGTGGRDVAACYDWYAEQGLAECARRGLPERSNECFQVRLAFERDNPCPEALEYAWGFEAIRDIQREIDAGRPLVATTPSHLFLIVGYRLDEGRFSLFWQDAGGMQEIPADASGLAQNLDSYWTDLAPVQVANDEPEIDQDGDGDGVVDFDESRRFSTDPANPDSDDDGVPDKAEIRASVWDAAHGYHRNVTRFSPNASDWAVEAGAAAANLAGRDFDRDGVPMELDPDSDAGGCRDGREDENLNGRRDADETHNFDESDDDCGPAPLGGSLTLSYDYSASRGADCIGRVDIKARFELEPIVTPGAPEIVTTFRARSITYDIATAGCYDAPGDSLVYEFDTGFRISGTLPLTEENLGFVMFWPSYPKFALQLPEDLTFPARPPNLLVGTYRQLEGDSVWPAETYVVFDTFEVESEPYYCEDPDSPTYAGPWDLGFCTTPTPCADTDSAPLECYTEPHRHYVLPFRQAFSWDSPDDEPGNRYHVGDVEAKLAVCDGCGDEFLE